MKKLLKNRYFLMGLALLAGLALGWFFKPSAEHEEIADEPTKEQIWTCSMHPQIRQPEPGDCPICGMDLIPLEEEQDAVDSLAVTMSPTAMMLANVATAKVGKTDPVKVIRLTGKVQEDERLVTNQTSHMPGRIERLMVNFTGEFIRTGQVLAYIYSPELATAQEELLQAHKVRSSQPQLYKAARDKLRSWKLSEAQIERILTLQEPLENFPLTADMSGYVVEKMVNPGDYVQRGEPLYQLANLSRVWVLFDVYESDLPWVNTGDSVRFSVQSLPGEQMEGVVSFVDPTINPNTRVAQARVVVKNRDGKLKPEMFVTGTLRSELEKGEEMLAIPKSAVMWTGERSVVYVRKPSEAGVDFVMREVILGPTLGDSYLVKEGLQRGEEIAVSGTFSIDAAAQLAGKPSMMQPISGDHQHAEENLTGEIMATDAAREMLRPLIQTYLELKDALVNDDIVVARKEAQSLQSAFHQVNPGLFTGASKPAWEGLSIKLASAIKATEKSESIDAIREGFLELSQAMIDLTRTFDPMDQRLYVQYCPMADNYDGGYWLSKEDQIRNPYYGASMLRCGEVSSVIE